jgi:hypothetical protein
MKTNLLNTNSKFKTSEIVGIVIAFIMKILNSNKIILFDTTNSNNSLFGLSKFFGSVVFFSFSTFVVFGIKGFFEMYSQKYSNIIMIVSGVSLALVIVSLSYHILFEE